MPSPVEPEARLAPQSSQLVPDTVCCISNVFVAVGLELMFQKL